MMKIAIVGAESTGKSALAEALSKQLSEANYQVTFIPEALREWCHREGRTPLMKEQMGIAIEQIRRVDSAPLCDFLLVDCPALMTAVYSDIYFADSTLYPLALADHRQYQLTLLMGTDLAWVNDGIQRDGPAVQQQVNHRLRQVLDTAGLPYTVIYGTGTTRTHNATRAIEQAAKSRQLLLPSTAASWNWHCENCSDAGCERRLFTDRLHSNTD